MGVDGTDTGEIATNYEVTIGKHSDLVNVCCVRGSICQPEA